MTNSTNTKRSLLISILSMIVCLAMLIGSTFAWFSDSVVSGKNQIIAGNLDVEMEYATLDNEGNPILDDEGNPTWNPVTKNVSLFKNDALWEPGYTQVVYLRVKNLGSLSLNYKLSMIVDDTPGQRYDEDLKRPVGIYLSKYLKFGAIPSDDESFFKSRGEAREAVENIAENLRDYTVIGGIRESEKATDIDYITLVVYMPEEVGNDANHLSNAVPTIDLGIQLEATQMMDENDSFGNDYDKNAFQNNSENGAFADLNQDTFSVSSEADLLEFADCVAKNDFAGKTITLANNITLTQANWVPIGTKNAPFKGTFDGGNHTISGLNITKAKNNRAGFFGKVENAIIKDLTVEGNITIGREIDYTELFQAGGICAAGANVIIQNCTNDVDIDVTGVLVDETHYPGLLIGGIVGSVDVDPKVASFTKCINLANLSAPDLGLENEIGSMIFVGGITSLINDTTAGGRYEFINCENKGKLTGTITRPLRFSIGEPWVK